MPAVTRLDLFRLHAAEYVAPKRPAVVATRPGRYLTIDGQGEPGGGEFREKVAALYAMAFTIKMGRKRLGQDYKVAGLEGLWWVSGRAGRAGLARPRREWRWKLLIRVPDFVRRPCLVGAARMLKEKGKGEAVLAVNLETIAEGRCIQALHVGPYATEATTLAAMEALARALGLKLTGRHHEIYLSDPARTKPEKLRTILRHPVRLSGAAARLGQAGGAD